MDDYCKSCYRTISSESALCPSCEHGQRPAGALGRVILIAGAAGLPLLLAGMLTLNLRLCFAGAAISGIAALLHALLALKA